MCWLEMVDCYNSNDCQSILPMQNVTNPRHCGATFVNFNRVVGNTLHYSKKNYAKSQCSLTGMKLGYFTLISTNHGLARFRTVRSGSEHIQMR